MLTLDNLLESVDNSVTSYNTDNQKSIYYIGNNIGNTKLIICYNYITKKIYSSADEWLYLIKEYYPNNSYYKILVNAYHDIVENKNIDKSYQNEHVLSFITSFSIGTVHGYAGLFYMINEVISNQKKYEKYKIIIFDNSNKGILEIINYFKQGSIIKNEIIVISAHKKYLFKSVTFIRNKWHMYPLNFKLKTIEKYMVDKNFMDINDKICIVKNSTSDRKTLSGIVKKQDLDKFCSKHKLFLLEPNIIDEITLINKLNKCSFLVVSWGTAFFKNYVYLSEKCKHVIVLVIGETYRNEYNTLKKHNILVNKFKKTKISYILADINLDINLSKYLC